MPCSKSAGRATAADTATKGHTMPAQKPSDGPSAQAHDPVVAVIITTSKPLLPADRQAILALAGHAPTATADHKTSWIPVVRDADGIPTGPTVGDCTAALSVVQDVLKAATAAKGAVSTWTIHLEPNIPDRALSILPGLAALVLNQLRTSPYATVCVFEAPVLTDDQNRSHAHGFTGEGMVLLPEKRALPRLDSWLQKIDPAKPVTTAALMERLRHETRALALPQLDRLSVAAQRLALVISRLRAPDGCPWDREQTFDSLRPYLIEEAYEAIDAAKDLSQTIKATTDSALGSDGVTQIKNRALAFADELGDVLLQVALNSQLAAEAQLFDLADVFEGLSQKMVRRHPHVFANDTEETVSSADEVTSLWDRVKEQERTAPGDASVQNSLLHGVAKKASLPTLEFAAAVSKRASKLGFCWIRLEDVWQDVESEIRELKHEVMNPSKPLVPKDAERIADELGDVVYALANLTVHLQQEHGLKGKLGFDDAVRQGLRKFMNRFQEMEAIYAEEKGQPLNEATAKALSLDTWNDLWRLAKIRRYR